MEKIEEKKMEKIEEKVNYPPVNIYEDGLSYKYQIIIPGFDKDNLIVEIDDDKYLFVIGNYKIYETKIGFQNANKILFNSDVKDFAEIPRGPRIIKEEYQIRSFRRDIELFEDCDPESVSSKLENGILTIKFMKKIKPRKRINVQIQ